MDNDEVLEEIIQSSETKFSILENIFCFISKFSMIASITSPLSFMSSNFSEKLILFMKEI